MKIGIFGGTFNPIHKGHIKASLCMYDTVGLDKLLVIPDRIPPHKTGEFASGEDRFFMTELAYSEKSIIGERNITVSDMELIREGKSYTVLTLRELSVKYPDAEFFLYVGSDMFYTLEGWYCGSEILRMCSIVTAPREANEISKMLEFSKKYKALYGTNCVILDYSPVVVSSTEIREALKGVTDENNAVFTNNLLTEKVARFIMKKGLYCD